MNNTSKGVLGMAAAALLGALVVVQPTPQPGLVLKWDYPAWTTNTEFIIYSKYDLKGTNDWFFVGTTTNLSVTMALKSASGLPVKQVFFTVLATQKQ